VEAPGQHDKCDYGSSDEKLLEQVETWPQEDHDERAEYAHEIEARRTGVYKMTDEERAAVEEGLAELGAGKFASEEQTADIFREARRPS
jgi:hypothetical protein